MGWKKQWSDFRQKNSNFIFICTSNDICDMNIGSEISITPFNLETTPFYLGIGFEASLF